MALVPRLLRPSVLIRRKAMYSGVLGKSAVWRAIAVIVFGRGLIARFFGRHPETIDAAALGPGRSMEVTTTTPLSRRRRRKLAKQGAAPPTLRHRRELARRWADETAARRAS